MKTKLRYTLACMTLLGVLSIFLMTSNKDNSETELLRAQHQEHLDKSPFKETKNLTKKERKAMALPPNAYNEQVWELTMDPQTGRPMTERLMEIQERLRSERANNRVGGAIDNPWIDRGPNNQGGRTRGIMFDPNDIGNTNPADDFTRVFAGAVSGGLWVNNDITDVNSTWSQVPGIPGNISVTVIIADPNDTQTFYIGAGESYTSGAAIGRGIWKSIDSGATWTNIFGGYTGTSNSNQNIDGIFYINDLVARDNAGTTELYAAVASAYFSTSATGSSAGNYQFHSLTEQGLYKSDDGGGTWNRFAIQHTDLDYKNPNDIEIDSNNNIWLTTTFSYGLVGTALHTHSGGDIYKSTDGITFTLEATIAGAARTELEVSATDANKFWVVANASGAKLFKTNDAFATITTMTQPNDVDNGIPSSDYTRGQAFYDLPIEADAAGNLYVGGIDLFRSDDDGVTWTQLSKWSNNNNLATLNNFVHADQHAIVFRPGDDNQAALGCDGGVFFANSMTNAAANLAGAIVEMEKDYNTVQFYYGSIDQVNTNPGDDLAGGTQDNGTFFKVDAAAGANGYSDPLTGDGGYTEIDGADGYAVTFYPGNSGRYIAYPTLVPFSSIGITFGGGGSFINQAELDTNLDILYCNATSGTSYRLERVREFIPGGLAQDNFYVGSGTMTQSPSALKVSQYTTTSTTLYVGQRNGVLWKVTDIDSGGGTWSTIGTFTGSISDIELGASEMEIFVTMHNYGVTSIWYTNDGGATWANKEGDFPDMPVKCILQNPLVPNEVIVGTELGVWTTEDFSVASPVWVQSYNGMSDVTVLDLDLRTSDNVILASTHGRGLFTSSFMTNDPLPGCNIVLESVVVTDETCLGTADGTITITATSSNPIEYSIDGGSTFFPGMNVFTGLADGTYDIVVRDVGDTACSASNVLYSTDFENPPFTVGNLVGQDGWVNHSGSGSLIQVNSDQAIETVQGGGSREDASISLGQTAVPGTIFNFEFDVTVNGASDATTTYFAHFKDDGTGFNSRVFVTAPTAATNNFTFAIGETSSSTPAATFAADFNYGQTYRLSGSYNFDTGISTLSVDGFSSIHSLLQADPGEDLSFWAFRQSGGNTSQVIDNLVISTSIVTINPGSVCNEAPVIGCPADITVNNDTGLCGAAVTFAATATGIPDPTISYSAVIDGATGPVVSGFVFPVGTTTVTATATNDAGSDSCTFKVTVNDNEDPVVTGVTDIIAVLDNTGNIVLNNNNDVAPAVTASDNCDIDWIRIRGGKNNRTFGCADILTNPNVRTIRVRDVNGNNTDVPVNVIVQDNRPQGNYDGDALGDLCDEDDDNDGCDDIVDPHPFSIQTATVVINGCDSSVANDVLGCSTLADILMDICLDSGNYSEYRENVSRQLLEWRRAGIITRAERTAIFRCAINNYNGCAGSPARMEVADSTTIEFGPFEVNAYPNPSSNAFNFRITTENKLDKVDIQVMDITGKRVHFNTFDSDESHKFGESLQAGIYFVTITQGEYNKTLRVIKH